MAQAMVPLQSPIACGSSCQSSWTGDTCDQSCFDEPDSVWRAERPWPFLRILGVVLEQTLAVVPAVLLYVAASVWNLSVPYALMGKAPFQEWPRRLQWAHVVSEGVWDACDFLAMVVLFHFAFRSLAQKHGLGLRLNLAIAVCAPAYKLVLQSFSRYDPKSLVIHLPMNLLFAGSLWANAAAAGFSIGRTRRQQCWIALVTGLAMFLPIATTVVWQFMLPRFTRPQTSAMELGLVGSVGVPAVFMATQVTVRLCCLELVRARGHPGEVSRFMVMPVLLESFGRRVLICSITELRYAFLANLASCLLDFATQVTVDARDALLFTAWHCRGPGEHFERRARRRLRADSLLLHVLSEHLAILSLSSFDLLVRLIVLRQPLGPTLRVWVLRVAALLPVRLALDVATFAVESRCGFITRRCLQLSMWHGIAVYEVWQLRKWELLRLMCCMALLSVAFNQLYIMPLYVQAAQ